MGCGLWLTPAHSKKTPKTSAWPLLWFMQKVQIWNISQISHAEGKTADSQSRAFPPRCSETTALSPNSVRVYLVECSSSLSLHGYFTPVLVQSQNLTEFGTSLGCPWGLLSSHLHCYEWISALLHLSASLTLWFLVMELPSLSSRSAGWRWF